jgi:hypothetical protein
MFKFEFLHAAIFLFLCGSLTACTRHQSAKVITPAPVKGDNSGTVPQPGSGGALSPPSSDPTGAQLQPPAANRAPPLPLNSEDSNETSRPSSSNPFFATIVPPIPAPTVPPQNNFSEVAKKIETCIKQEGITPSLDPMKITQTERDASQKCAAQNSSPPNKNSSVPLPP